MEKNISPEQLRINLQNFTGTEYWHKFSVLFPKLLITDGVKYLADIAGCYWLLDILGSVQYKEELTGEEFQVLKLRKTKGDGAIVTVENGNGIELYSQNISFTDFPLEEIIIWFSNYETEKIIMLPREY